MFDVFKKHIIKNDQKLIPVLDDMKLFKITLFKDGEKEIDEEVEKMYTTDFYETFKLPYEVTGIELKDTFALVIDKYKNQKGLNNDRFIYILTRININQKNDCVNYIYNTGLNLFISLMGIALKKKENSFLEPVRELNNYQSKILTNVALLKGKKYILYKLQTVKKSNTKNSNVELPESFVIINKKKSKKINIESNVFDNKDYFENIVAICLKEILMQICWYVNYVQIEGVDVLKKDNN
jgi:hypothetical protein